MADIQSAVHLDHVLAFELIFTYRAYHFAFHKIPFNRKLKQPIFKIDAHLAKFKNSKRAAAAFHFSGELPQLADELLYGMGLHHFASNSKRHTQVAYQNETISFSVHRVRVPAGILLERAG